MKFICIGKNYEAHAREMGSKVPVEQVLFIKPETALLRPGEHFYYPDFSENIHFEVELLIKIKKNGKNINQKFAHTYYSELGLGIDFTARDIQNRFKKEGYPWEKAKGFDRSAAVSLFHPISEFPALNNLNFRLEKNGEVVQQANSSDMIHSFDGIIAEASRFFTLKKGDVIFSGTPEGVGPVKIGDVLTGYIEDRKILEVKIR